MLPRLASLIVPFALLAMLLAPAAAQERRFRAPDAGEAREQRFALVIGNRAYPQGALATPENDAKDVAAALKKLGFTVIVATNLDPTRFRSTIRRFEDDLSRADGRVIA